MEKVKYAALALCLVSTGAEAQSPYLSVSAFMDINTDPGKKYKMEMKICQPHKMTNRGDWFTHDTSTINFSGLKNAEVDCGEFRYNGEGIEVLSGNVTYDKYNSYSFANQVFAWEKIIVFRVTNESDSSAAKPQRMYIVLPVKYKSFVTHIKMENIPFIDGMVLDAGKALGSYSGGSLRIRLKPDVSAGIPVADYVGKAWVE